MPSLSGKSYHIAVHGVIPDDATEGVLISYGGREGGFVLYVHGSRLLYMNNLRNAQSRVMISDVTLPRGEVTLAFDFALVSIHKSDNPCEGNVDVGTGRLFINDQQVAEAEFLQALEFGYSSRSLGIGRAFGSPVSDAIPIPFEFAGK